MQLGQLGQPGGPATPESSNKISKELEPGYIPLHILKRSLQYAQDDIAKHQGYGQSHILEKQKSQITAMKRGIERHPDNNSDDLRSAYLQNERNYHPGMSFTEDQKELIDRLIDKYKHSAEMAIDSTSWKYKSTASDIEIVDNIRKSLAFFHEYVSPQDSEDFERLFPQSSYERFYNEIRVIDREISLDYKFGKGENVAVLKGRKKELLLKLTEDLQRHLAD